MNVYKCSHCGGKLQGFFSECILCGKEGTLKPTGEHPLSLIKPKLDRSICPNCYSEETYCEQDWLAKELMHCESCGYNYEVIYSIKINEIKKK